MAALTLTPELLCVAALAARDDARRLRIESASRRGDARRALETAEMRRTRAILMKKRMLRTRDLRYRSAWSDLPWQMPDSELDRVLVAHDGET